jgi:hypothetical protein
MFAYFHAKSAALWGRHLVSFRKRLVPAFGVVALCLFAAACVTTPSAPYAGPDPSDPGVRVPAVDYRSTIGRYTSRRPVEPAPWREQNERVAPAPKQ